MAPVLFCSKLKVIVWKNFLIRKHHWILTLCEIIIPTLLFLIIAYARAKLEFMHKEYISVPTYSPEYTSEQFYNDRFNHETNIYYAPKNQFTSDLIHEVQLKFTLNNEAVKGFDSVSELTTYYRTLGFNNETVMAVIFNDYSQNFNYVIRPFDRDVDWKTDSLYRFEQSYIPEAGSAAYIYNGFIALQMALDTSFIELTSKKKLPVNIMMQEFPYPPYVNDSEFTDVLLYVLSAITVLSFSFLCSVLLRNIVEEKRSGIKELMKMMGLTRWMLWLGWFLHAFTVNFISVCVITFLMKVALWDVKLPPITYCSGSLFFVFLLFYCAAGITFCFAISTLFNSPTLAMTIGFCCWAFSYIIPDELFSIFHGASYGLKLLSCIFPNSALNFGYSAIAIFESRESDLSWINVFQSPSGGSDDITMGNVLLMFLFDICFYICITFYIENIKPGPYGISKPFCFPILSILKGSSKINRKENETIAKEYCRIEAALNLIPGIQIRNLYKRFGNQFVVNDFSIDIYEGQITVLLGHNGAGKTTTMSMITGMIGATNGQILIRNKDIKYHLNEVRSSLGLCPQHNLQFSNLTVIEHLMFFSMLKGATKAAALNEAKIFLNHLNLSHKQNNLASSLSGGMKRKLSLGMALIGNSKVLILDEPTSGLDPEARREIWDLLLALRGSRTILITTHSMEEADVLGDRIAIMDHGQLICYGTSMFLKKEYGAGYHLTIIFHESLKGDLNNVKIDKITHIVQKTINEAVLQSSLGNSITFLLPHETKPYFSTLLADLENKKSDLGIININMSVTTLEEVFLRVGNMVIKDDKMQDKNINGTNKSKRSSTNSMNSNSSTKSIGNKKLKLQFLSLLKKRMYFTKMKWQTYLIPFLVTLIAASITLYMGESQNKSTSTKFKEFNFNLANYGNTKIFYSTHKSDNELVTMGNYYNELVKSQRGDPQNVISVSDGIIKDGIKNIEFYKQHMVVAAEFNKSDEKIANAMYSNRALHGAPISLNLLTNAILKTIMGDEYSITTSNSPLPTVTSNTLTASEVNVSVYWFICFPTGLLYLAAVFAIFPQVERASNIKQLQLMCGIRSIFYWLSSYLFDLILYVSVVFIIIILAVIYGSIFNGMFSGQNEIGALILILFAYGLSVIPFAYLFSYKRTESGASETFQLTSFFGTVIMIVICILFQFSDNAYYINVSEKLFHVMVLLPHFGLTYCLMQFSRNAVWNYNWRIQSTERQEATCRFDYNPCCDGYETAQCLKYRSYFYGQFAIGTYVLEMAASLVIYFSILLILETNFVPKYWNKMLIFIYKQIKSKKTKDVPDYCVNDDVSTERQRVYSTLKKEKNINGTKNLAENNTDLLLVYNIEKNYWGNKVVKGVSFGVKAGDCFGLLGVNGAGKTTTFRLLTGDEPLINGNIRLRGINNETICISEDSKKYLEMIGYCPQFDAINDVLTGRQMLTLFAELRGIHEGVKEEVDMWLKALDLEEHADKMCGKYSGGNKRKLSMAVALIGGPLLIMLDEPTSGVDPVSRRKLWDTLMEIQNQETKPSVMLTSHSMEECEALCNKLAIMKAGQLECYGTIPELKNKYGQGFTVLLKLKPLLSIVINSMDDDDSTASQSQPLSGKQHKTLENQRYKDVQEVDEDPKEVKCLITEFEEIYKGCCTLRDKHSGLLHYHINDKSKRWSTLFQEIEELKQHHHVIEDYNISETTLEEVFLSIARSEVKAK